MRLKFEKPAHQTHAVVADCFTGQLKREGMNYRMDSPATVLFTQITSDQVKYDVVDSYGTLMELVTGPT